MNRSIKAANHISAFTVTARSRGGHVSVRPELMVLVLLIFLTAFSGTLWAQGKPPVFQLAPMRDMHEPAGQNFGYVPPPMDLSHIRPPDRIIIMDVPPAAWDWRYNNGVTSVKNQNPYGTCWSFAVLGDLESKVLLLDSATYNFSEQNVVSCNEYSVTNSYSPFPVDCNSGGWSSIAINHLAAKGAVLETCDPYPDCGTISCTSCPPVQRVTDWRVLSGGDTVTPEVEDSIKYAVYHYGPVKTSMFAGDTATFERSLWRTEFGYYDGSYALYYEGEGGTNHAVLIVGYDDNMSHAGGNGAWIVKNSWGELWGDTGYFYIAYGSASMGKNANYIYSYGDFNSTDKVYYYDNYGYWSSAGCGPTTWGLVRFTPTDDGSLEAVDFWAVANDVSYEIEIYDDFDGSSLTNLLDSMTGSLVEPGYYSITLSSPLPVYNGDEINIKVKLTTPGFNYPVPVDEDLPTQTNKCYLSCNGSSWIHVGTGSGYDWDVGIRAMVSGTDCTPGSGPCCDSSGFFRDAGYKCAEDIDTDYACDAGTACGDDVYVSHLDQYCSGSSSACDGDTTWDGWSVSDDCTAFEICSPGLQFCQNPGDGDGDGLHYCEEEGYGTSDADVDSDDDLMDDKYEVDNSLDPTVADSMTADYDDDGNPNVHEYFNGTLAGDILNPDPYCGVGGFCFAESGSLPTAGMIDGPDLTQVRFQLRGVSSDYSGVIPNNGNSADVNGTGIIDGPDVTIYRQVLSGSWGGDLTGAARYMNKTMPAGGSVIGGATIEVEVLTSATSGVPRSGYGVVFWIDSTTQDRGAIYGGDGSGEGSGFPSGSRYDVTGTIAGGGKARVYLHVLSSGTIKVKAKIPANELKHLPEVPASENLEIELTATP